MDIKSTSVNFGQTTVKELKAEKSGREFGQAVSEAARAKRSQNVAILEASAQASLSAGNEPLSLVLKSALENINDALKEATGEENAIETAVQQGIDFSPEATADRIVTQATAFFDSYKANHPNMNEEDAKSSFIELIRGGVDKGFTEARNLLEGLKVLEGDVASNIDKTYDLVQQGLEAFLNAVVDNPTDESSAPAE